MRLLVCRYTIQLVMAALFVVAALTIPTAGQAQWLTLPRGVDYTVPTKEHTATLRIPVRLVDGVAWNAVNVVVTDVHREGRGEEWMRHAVDRLTKSPTDARSGPALLLPVVSTAFYEAGTYMVELEATTLGQPLQRLQLRLTRAPAVLAAAPVQVRHEVPLVRRESGWGGSLLVAETSGAAGVIALRPLPPLLAVPGGATLRFGDPRSVPVGTPVRIPFEVNGILPLGSTAGTIRLTSPQLGAPVDVPVTIFTHRPHWLLVAVILAGLILGWLVRTFLTGRIERNQLRVQADDVLQRMETAVETHTDTTFQEEVRGLANTLREARDGKAAEALATVITAADTGLRTAFDRLKTRLDEARERGVVLGRLVRTEWSLPSAPTTALLDARKALKDAEEALVRGDAAGACQLLDRAEAGLKDAFRNALNTWPIERRTVLDELTALPPAVRNRAQPWIAAIETDLEAVQVPGDDEIESLRSPLAAMHRARLREEQLTEALVEWVDALGAEVQVVLGTGTPNAKAIAEFRAALETFRARAGTSSQDPDERLRILAGDLPVLNRAIRTVVTSHTSQAAMAEVTALLAEGRYVEAAQRAARQEDDEGPVLRDTPESQKPAGMAAAEAGGVFHVPEPGIAGARGVSLLGLGIPEPVRVHRARVWKQLMLDQALLTVIVGAAITILGYYLYSTDYVGTGRELLTIFLWAFGLDVGVQTLVAQSARLAGPSAGAGAG